MPLWKNRRACATRAARKAQNARRKKLPRFPLLALALLVQAAIASAQSRSFQHISSASIQGFFESHGFKPEVLPNRSMSTDFPYNIMLQFDAAVRAPSALAANAPNAAAQNPSHSAELSAEKTRVIISISQENLPFFLDELLQFAKELKAAPPVLPVTILLTAGDENVLPGASRVPQGTVQFINTLNPVEPHAVIIIEPKSGAGEELNIIPGVPYKASPKWLLSSLFAAAKKAGTRLKTDGFSVTFYRIGLIQRDRILGEYLDAGIPAVLLESGSAQIFPLLKEAIPALEAQAQEEWDRHYSVISTAAAPIFISENVLIIVLVLISFFTLLYLTFFSFIGAKNGARHLDDLKKAWFLIPLLVLLTWWLLYAAQVVTKTFYRAWPAHIFWALVLKAAISVMLFVLVSSLHRFVPFPTRDYVYGWLLSIMALADVFVFAFLDLSTVVLFSVQLLVALLFTQVKRLVPLVLLGLILLAPFVPLVSALITMPRQNILFRFFNASIAENFLLACLIIPAEFAWVRIIVRMNVFGKHRKIRFPYIATAAMIACVGAVLFIFAATAAQERIAPPARGNPQDEGRRTELRAQSESFMDRTRVLLTIDSTLAPVRYDVKISVENGIAVYDANFPFESSDANRAAQLLLDEFPPNPMTVQYTTERGEASRIEVTAYLRNKDGRLSKETHALLVRADGTVEEADVGAGESNAGGARGGSAGSSDAGESSASGTSGAIAGSGADEPSAGGTRGISGSADNDGTGEPSADRMGERGAASAGESSASRAHGASGGSESANKPRTSGTRGADESRTGESASNGGSSKLGGESSAGKAE